MNKTFDLIIAHRVYPGLAESAICFSEKFSMVKVNLNSILNSLQNINTLLFVIFDNCPDEYMDYYINTLNKDKYKNIVFKYVNTKGLGNNMTFGLQLTFLLLKAKNAPYLFFSEDDYFYREYAFNALIDFMDNNKDVCFATPLDHPDRYTHIMAENIKTEIRVNDYCHGRTVGTTCCTFMVRSSTIHEAKTQLSSYARGTGDGLLWLGITKDAMFSPKHIFLPLLRLLKGEKIETGAYGNGGDFMVLFAGKYFGLNIFKYKKGKLWSPIPSLAVHLCKPSISPCCKDLLKEIET